MFRPESRVGTVVKRYRLAQLLSSGGMGSLYRATHLRTGREVAVKFLLDLDDTARFQIEARATVELKHPNVVDMLDMDETEDGVPFLVMELLHGQTLAAHLEQAERMMPRECLHWLVPVMGAVAMAHDRGILHRDIKPENIFMSRAPDGRIVPKLLDFGVAKTRTMPTITRSGAIVGTPAYMSPEQALAEQELTPATDVWSMGVVLFECCAGTRPFQGDSATSVLLKVVRDPAPSLESTCPDLPLPWSRAVDRGLQRSVPLRPRDMGEYARRLLHGALESRLDLPFDPDPLGLPEWRSWLEEGSSATLSVDALPGELRAAAAAVRTQAESELVRGSRSSRPIVSADSSAPTVEAEASDLRRALATPRTLESPDAVAVRRFRWDVLAIVLGVVVSIAAWFWLQARQPLAEPAREAPREPQVQAAPPPQPEPVTLTPVGPVPVPEPIAAPAPVETDTAPPDRVPLQKPKPRPRPKAQPVPQPPPAPEPEKKDNEGIGIEKDWR
jgi:eukaryotic-like serine/threonine-protein kinase